MSLLRGFSSRLSITWLSGDSSTTPIASTPRPAAPNSTIGLPRSAIRIATYATATPMPIHTPRLSE